MEEYEVISIPVSDGTERDFAIIVFIWKYINILPYETRKITSYLVVVAVNKASIAAVSTEWLARGFAVLCETPAALEEDALRALLPEIRQDFCKSLGVLRIPPLKRTCKNNAIIAPLCARR